MSENLIKRSLMQPSMANAKAHTSRHIPKREKFDFNKMKDAATSDNPAVRKIAFIDYFDRFNEFPSFLFDNDKKLDPRLAATTRDISEDQNSSKELLDGVRALLTRLAA